jgi:hypothetical protein
VIIITLYIYFYLSQKNELTHDKVNKNGGSKKTAIDIYIPSTQDESSVAHNMSTMIIEERTLLVELISTSAMRRGTLSIGVYVCRLFFSGMDADCVACSWLYRGRGKSSLLEIFFFAGTLLENLMLRYLHCND